MPTFHLFSPEREHVKAVQAKSLHDALKCVDPAWGIIVKPEAWGARLSHETDGERQIFGYLVPRLTDGREHYRAKGTDVVSSGSTLNRRTKVMGAVIANCSNMNIAKLLAQAPAFELELCDKLYWDALNGKVWSHMGTESGIIEALTEAGTLTDRPELAFYLAVCTGEPIPGKETP